MGEGRQKGEIIETTQKKNWSNFSFFFTGEKKKNFNYISFSIRKGDKK